MNIFDHARAKAAQSPTPTTMYDQLAKLGRRSHYGRTRLTDQEARETAIAHGNGPRYPWMDRKDICG